MVLTLTFLQEISGWRKRSWIHVWYKRLRNEFTGVLTGKNFFGGSLIRPEALDTDIAQSMLETKGELKVKQLLFLDQETLPICY
jgi:glutamate dehydrogenase/leucine dehydrogenase